MEREENLKKIIVFLLLITAPLAHSEGKKGAWEEKKNDKGIVVYNRKVPGVALKEFKAVAHIRSGLDRIMHFFNDIENASNWVENVDFMSKVKEISPSEYYTFAYTNAPWPVSDRWVVVHNTITTDPDTGTVTVLQKNVPLAQLEEDNISVPRKKAIAVEKVYGEWTFTPLDTGGVQLTYFVSSDPGGDIPAWIINIASVSQPYKTILGLKRMCEDR